MPLKPLPPPAGLPFAQPSKPPPPGKRQLRKGLTEADLRVLLAEIQDSAARAEIEAWAYGEKELTELSDVAKAEGLALFQAVEKAGVEKEPAGPRWDARAVRAIFEANGFSFAGEIGKRVLVDLLRVVHEEWNLDYDAALQPLEEWIQTNVSTYLSYYRDRVDRAVALERVRGVETAMEEALAKDTPRRQAERGAFNAAFKPWVERQSYGDPKAKAYLNSLGPALFEKYYQQAMFPESVPNIAANTAAIREAVAQGARAEWTAELAPSQARGPQAFLQATDMQALAKEQGTESANRAMQLAAEMFKRYIAPLYANAKTPEDVRNAQMREDQFQSALPKLQDLLAQDPNMGLDLGQWIQTTPLAQNIIRAATEPSDEALRKMAAAAKTTYQTDILNASTLASQGFGVEEGAAMMGITEAEYAAYAQGALQMRQFQVGQATQSFTPSEGGRELPGVRETLGSAAIRANLQGTANINPQAVQGLQLQLAGVDPQTFAAIQTQLANVPPEQYAQAVGAIKARLGLSGGPGLALGTAAPFAAPALTRAQLVNQLLTPGVNPQAAQQLATMTPEARAELTQAGGQQLAKRNAALNYLTGGEWGQKEQERIVAESQEASARAASEAREAIRGTALYNVKDFQGRVNKQPLAEQQLAQEMLNNPAFEAYIDEFVRLKGGQLEQQQAQLRKQYGAQIAGSYLPTGNRELMLRGFINDVLPAYRQLQENQKRNVETLQKRVSASRTIAEQNQARADLGEYQKKIAPPPEKNPYADTEFLDAEVRWAAEHDRPNPYPTSQGMQEIYAQSFKGSATSPNYPRQLVARQQAALIANRAMAAEANANALADLQRRAGGVPPVGVPGGGRAFGGGPIQVGAEAPVEPAPAFGGLMPIRLDSQGNEIPTPGAPAGFTGRRPIGGLPGGGGVATAVGGQSLSADGRRLIGPPVTEQAGRQFQGGPVGAGPIQLDAQGNVISDLSTGRIKGMEDRRYMGPPVQELVGKAMKDTKFTPELSQFIAQNRQNVGGTFETTDQVAARLGPQVSNLYSAYQAKQTKPPELGDVNVMQPVGRRPLKQPPPDAFDYQGF